MKLHNKTFKDFSRFLKKSKPIEGKLIKWYDKMFYNPKDLL